MSRFSLALLLLLHSTAVLCAESKISFRQLTRTFPVAAQRGTTREIEVSSNFSLNESHSVFFAPSGPEMEFAEPKEKPDEWADPEESDIGTPFRFRVRVPNDQRPGVYEYRIATRQAVSSVGHLLITDHPVTIEGESDNDNRQTAQPVPVPAAICGTISDFEDVDYYRIQGSAGQDLVCQIFAQRVTRAIHTMAIRYPKIHLMDAMLTLFGPDGRIIAQNDNYIGGDAMLHIKLPESGDYILEVRDTRYAGDRRYVYCVEVSHDPVAYGSRPLAYGTSQTPALIFSRPENANSDTASNSSILAVASASPSVEKTTRQNLAIDIPEKLLAAIPGQPPADYFWRGLTASGRPSNPVALLVSPHPQIVAPNGLTTDTPHPITLPLGISGSFTKPNETHAFRFSARKGDYSLFEVHSQRRGLAVDSVLSVLDSQGQEVANNDDSYFSKDAKLYFQAPADGNYVITVRDLTGRSGDRFAYHLNAEPSGPDFEIHGEYYYGMLAPGGQAIWFVKLKRLNGFEGAVEIRATGLPRGVSLTPVTIPPGMNHCSLIFSAASDAPVNAALVHVSGRAQLPRANDKTVTAVRHAHVTAELRRAGASRFYRAPIKTQLLAVTKPLDLTKVTAEPAEITLPRGGTAEITIRIQRNTEYSDQVLLDMAFSFFSTKYGEQLPNGVTMSSSSKTKLTGDDLEAKIILEANSTALLVKRHPIAALARVPITYSIMTNYASNPMYLTVTPP
ncbi:MAG: hypothetical protein VX346_25095 [Planctomycetota bacterium]|nr:hypothetical protein [Planctomycetota bacterium]